MGTELRVTALIPRFSLSSRNHAGISKDFTTAFCPKRPAEYVGVRPHTALGITSAACTFTALCAGVRAYPTKRMTCILRCNPHTIEDGGSPKAAVLSLDSFKSSFQLMQAVATTAPLSSAPFSLPVYRRLEAAGRLPRSSELPADLSRRAPRKIPFSQSEIGRAHV